MSGCVWEGLIQAFFTQKVGEGVARGRPEGSFGSRTGDKHSSLGLEREIVLGSEQV